MIVSEKCVPAFCCTVFIRRRICVPVKLVNVGHPFRKNCTDPLIPYVLVPTVLSCSLSPSLIFLIAFVSPLWLFQMAYPVAAVV